MIATFTGKVIKSTGSWYSVIYDNLEVRCRLKGIFRNKGIDNTNPISVGDVVDFNFVEKENTGIIIYIHPRKNYLIRKATKLSKVSHIIAANIDQVVIITSLIKPRTSTGFIDRILITAEAYHIPAVIIFNKVDLYDDANLRKLEYYKNTYENAGYSCLVTSVSKNIRLIEFKAIIQGKTSLLSGHSGVGKSAIINSVDSSLNLKIGEISEYHSKGIHTTTFANMFPLKFGGFIIDTPGIKEFGLVEFDRAELGQRFPEIRNLMHKCRFSNCLHVKEPGCAVKEAVSNGDIVEFRYNNYLNMLDSI